MNGGRCNVYETCGIREKNNRAYISELKALENSVSLTG